MSESTTTSEDSSAPRRRLGVEAVVVFGLTVGVSIGMTLVRGIASRDASAFTTEHLYGTVAYEALLAAILLPWLVRRGWKPAELAGPPTPVDVVRGAGLWMLAIVLYSMSWVTFAALQPELAKALATEHRFTGVPATVLAGVIGSVVNPVFEEFLWLGYFAARLAPRIGLRAAAALSIVLRVAVHAYQGPWAVLGILPIALAFTWYYGRTRRIWPVVVAHVFFDAIGLAQRLTTS